ncbi:hypothetical protein LTR86_008801 [Recurvomyces mirabilis]|nr:hypothetical protein LTR86_008801 [Recurvomyces mirabilis]
MQGYQNTAHYPKQPAAVPDQAHYGYQYPPGYQQLPYQNHPQNYSQPQAGYLNYQQPPQPPIPSGVAPYHGPPAAVNAPVPAYYPQHAQSQYYAAPHQQTQGPLVYGNSAPPVAPGPYAPPAPAVAPPYQAPYPQQAAQPYPLSYHQYASPQYAPPQYAPPQYAPPAAWPPALTYQYQYPAYQYAPQPAHGSQPFQAPELQQGLRQNDVAVGGPSALTYQYPDPASWHANPPAQPQQLHQAPPP